MNELIAKYISGSSSELENKQICEFIAESKENEALFQESVIAWNKTQRQSSDSSKRFNSGAAYQKFLSSIEEESRSNDSVVKEPKRMISMRIVSSIAASVAILIGVYFFYNTIQHETMVTYATSNEATHEYKLSDGTIVTLKNGAQLIAPKEFYGSNRTVEASGTLFFSVAKNAEKPFIIKYDEVQVTVLGTSFELEQFEDRSAIISVETGKVEVLNTATSEKVFVTPGKAALFNANSGSLHIEENSNTNYNSWKTGLLVFQNDSFEKVVSDLESHYNVSINYDENKLNSCNLTAKFEHESLDVVLESIKLTFGVEVIQKPSGEIEIIGEGC